MFSSKQGFAFDGFVSSRTLPGIPVNGALYWQRGTDLSEALVLTNSLCVGTHGVDVKSYSQLSNRRTPVKPSAAPLIRSFGRVVVSRPQDGKVRVFAFVGEGGTEDDHPPGILDSHYK